MWILRADGRTIRWIGPMWSTGQRGLVWPSSRGDCAVNDTSPQFEAMLDERYRRMTPDERVRIAASMYDTARAIVLSSLPPGLSDARCASRLPDDSMKGSCRRLP